MMKRSLVGYSHGVAEVRYSDSWASLVKEGKVFPLHPFHVQDQFFSTQVPANCRNALYPSKRHSYHKQGLGVQSFPGPFECEPLFKSLY